MKILVLFGSSSDEYVYGPLNEKLSKKHEVEFHVLSAHRNPTEVREAVTNFKGDLLIAGAGLAAHLPGVVASLTNKPVIGVSVEACFEGLDSICSIMQMPYGVPVLTYAPAKTDELVAFVDELDKTSLTNDLSVYYTESNKETSHMQKEMGRFMELAKEKGFNVFLNPAKQTGVAINMVDEKTLSKTGLVINTPVLSKDITSSMQAGLQVFADVAKGGAWVGVNNSRNALLLVEKFKRIKE